MTKAYDKALDAVKRMNSNPDAAEELHGTEGLQYTWFDDEPESKIPYIILMFFVGMLVYACCAIWGGDVDVRAFIQTLLEY